MTRSCWSHVLVKLYPLAPVELRHEAGALTENLKRLNHVPEVEPNAGQGRTERAEKHLDRSSETFIVEIRRLNIATQPETLSRPQNTPLPLMMHRVIGAQSESAPNLKTCSITLAPDPDPSV
ncbi:unnamed protein product [Pleuronectes platessa]|uniref:Uncharacterized protein n=1 Tax=Pleuronectes platessa TaxID=8262 RepID=A0A9N7Y4L8_PLEPL|nr:unnamed protein product [Pleuronectes platessa]